MLKHMLRPCSQAVSIAMFRFSYSYLVVELL